MLRIKKDIDLKILEKYGFKYANGIYQYTRVIDGITVWVARITTTHHYLQITVYEPCIMAKELQCLIYDLTIDGIVKKGD